jgi:heat shock protein HtpX
MINALLRRLKAEHDLPDTMPAEMTALAITEGKKQGFSLARILPSALRPPLSPLPRVQSAHQKRPTQEKPPP